MSPHEERPGRQTEALTDPPPSKSLVRSLPSKPKNDLRDLYRNAIDDYFDASAYGSVMAAEASDREAWSA